MQIPALNWIIEYLENNNIPYVVCGGLAARAYGSSRELADIDMYVPDEYLQQIAEMGKEFVTFGPVHHINEKWDLTYVQLEYQNQIIEIGSDKACKIFNSKAKQWHEKNIRFNNYEYRSIYGKRIKVMDKSDLISYKKILNREVDIEDVKQIQ